MYTETDLIGRVLEHERVIIVAPSRGALPFVRRVNETLGPLADDERLDVAWLTHGARLGGVGPTRRPLRIPHHTASAAALTGSPGPGAMTWRPGEASLATHGVLAFDEVACMSPHTLDAVGIAIREGYVPHRGTRYPARPRVVLGLARACCCGALPNRCVCEPAWIERQQHRVERAAYALGASTIRLDVWPAEARCA